VSQPNSLIYLALRAPGDARDGLSFNYPLFVQLRDASRDQVRLFGMSDQRREEAIFDDSREPERVYGQWVSGDALGIFGLKPAVGRLLTPADDREPGRHPVTVLSYDFWRRRFNGDPAVLGRWVTIRGNSLQVIGVVQKGFTGVEPGIATDLWMPMMMHNERVLADASTRWFRIWGRMQPDVASEQARATMQPVLTNFRRADAATRPLDERARLERSMQTAVYLRSAAHGPSNFREDFARAAWVLGGVAALVLLIASANVSSLLVARATSRERELALRISIGAGRARVMQQMLVESALLAVASCGLGALIGYITAPWVVSMLSTSRSIVYLDLQMDWRVVTFLVIAGCLITGLFGVGPAVRASAVAPHDALKSGSGKLTGKVGLFKPLIAGQIAFGFVVLFVAALCLTSFVRLLRTDLGFDSDGVAILKIEARELQGDPLAVWEQLHDRLRQMPGIESASFSHWALFEGPGRNKSVRVPGRAIDPDDPWYLGVSPGFLKTMGIPLVAGRDFEWRDIRQVDASAVIVNQSFAKRYFPGELPVGKRFFRVDGGAVLTAQEIIGVAADAKYTDLRAPAPPTVYDAYRPLPTAAVQLRTRLDSGSLIAALRDELPRAHPSFRVTDVTSQSTLVGNHLVRDRALALLSVMFSVVAIVLVAVGLYGVLTYSVLQRTREIGIRVALGARPIRVARLVVNQLGTFAGLGLIAGVVGGIAAARYIAVLLYEARPSAASSLALPLFVLVAVCAVAAVLPLVRATRVDPVIALRDE
jgi:predicted permease